MAVYKRDIIDINLETGNIYRSWLKHSIGYKDQKADHFGVRVFRDGEAVSLTGVSVQGVFMPPQGSPIAITSGNIVSGNVAEVVLPQACYNYDGQFTLAIKLVDSTNSVTGTVRIVDGMVDNTHASGTVAPTSAVPTYQEVLSVYEQAITVIGKSVRFDTDQSLTDTQKTTARTNIAAASTGELSDLKSALLDFAKIPGDEIINVSDFTERSATSGFSYETDTTNKTITITNTSSSSYPCLQTVSTYMQNHVTPGKTYLLHAKAERISGNPDIRVAIRGVSGNTDGVANSVKLGSGGEGFITFVADSYMKRISLFVRFGSASNAVVTFSELSLKEYNTTGIDDFAREEIEKTNGVIKRLENLPTENLVEITDFSVDENTTHVTDTENNSVNVTSYTSNNYNNLSTPGTWIGTKIVPGKTYRLHAKAEKVSGSPYMVVGIRGVQGNVNTIAKRIEFGTQGGDDFVDFVADEYMKRIALFVSFGSSTINSVAKFSEIWIKEYNVGGDGGSESEFDAIQKTKNARFIFNNAVTPLTILHFSDIHADATAMGRIIRKSEEYGTLIDDKICTGDMCANDGGSISSWWNADVMTCIGNHDSAKYTSSYDWTYYDMAQRDAWYIAPFESGWGITHTSGTSYYYKDYTTQKVRLIVMDAMLYTDNGEDATTQTAWLQSLLADAITNNLHVLIAIHAPHGGAVNRDCSFSSYVIGEMPVQIDCTTPDAVINAVSDAIGNGLNFIGYLVGHTHQDNIWDAKNDGTQLMYCITCGAVSQKTQWVDKSDLYRDATLDAFNLVTIDTSQTLVKIVRGGGADIDRRMRTRKAICFNYSTGEIIGEVL